MNLAGAFWDRYENIDLNTLGFVIVGLCLATFVIAAAVWHFGHIEERWSTHLSDAGPAR